MYCVVKDCGNVWNPTSNVIFHSFPKDPEKRKKWLSIIPLKGKFYESAKICSEHFKPEDYDPARPKRLLNSALPVYSIQLCSCGDSVKACTTPFKCLVSPDVRIPTKSDTCSTASEKKHSYCEKDKQSTLSENITFATPFKGLASPDVRMPTKSDTCSTVSEKEHSYCEKDKQTTLSENITFATPFKGLASPDVRMPTKSDTCSTVSEKEHSYCEKDKQTAHRESIVVDENEPPAKRRRLKDFNVQCKIKTPREKCLEKKKKVLEQKVARNKKKIKDLKSLVNIVRNYTSQSEIENILQGNFAEICKHFKKKSTVTTKYSDEVKSFALTLHFYSPKAYSYLRSIISLPHSTTLWRSISSFDCSVGFLNEVFEYLKLQIVEKPYLKNVALIFDSMSLKQDIAYAPKLGKIFGYVDLGSIPVSDPEQLASEALAFMIVSYTNYFKCPIGYFFTPGSLSGDLLGQLVKTALILLNEVGITVRSITCDGAKSNTKAYETLGCSFTDHDFRPHFTHPNGISKVHCLLDAVHMLKLARNVLFDHGLKSPDGDISFKYIEELHKVQEMEGLKFSNKITGTHVKFQNKKMNVRLAAQILSSSVADAIDFLRNSGNPTFDNSQATTYFIRVIDRLFDYMNCRSPFGKNFKSPLSFRNKEIWQTFFRDTADYLKTLKIGDTYLRYHNRKTFCLGFLMNINSLSALFEELTTLPENPLKYFLTFKCSQDNLEIFFSLIRARGRTQDNPSPLEFRYILRKLLFRNSVQPSINANYIDDAFHTNHIIDFKSKTDSLIEKNYENNDDDLDDLFNEMIKNLESPQLSAYQENVLYYITGFIVYKILQKNSCTFCHLLLTTENDKNDDHNYCVNVNKYSAFTTFVNRGKLCFASDAAYEIVRYSDSLFRHTVSKGLLHSKINHLQSKLVLAVQEKFQPLLQELFVPKHPVNDICMDLHETEIIKFISNMFLKMRIHSFLKNHTQKLLGDIRTKRQKLHKSILFSHV